MKKILFVFLLFVSQISLGQYYDPDYAKKQNEKVSLEKVIFSLDAFSPGLTIESAIGPQNSIVTSFATGIAISTVIYSNGDKESEVFLYPLISASYRNYYNLDKRKQEGKPVAFNSGNYFGLHVSYQSEPFSNEGRIFNQYNTGFMAGPVWGIQRNGTFTFNFCVGPGLFATDQNDLSLTIIGDLSIGLNLTKLFRKE
jgi:hypothetical protein